MVGPFCASGSAAGTSTSSDRNGPVTAVAALVSIAPASL